MSGQSVGHTIIFMPDFGCPRWVRGGLRIDIDLCRLFPHLQTSLLSCGRSLMCQQRSFRVRVTRTNLAHTTAKPAPQEIAQRDTVRISD